MQGFFSHSEFKQVDHNLSKAECHKCQLYKTCKSPKMPVSGKGRGKILAVGEAPGKNEDDKNRAFVGDCGELVEETFAQYGIDFRKDCHITNALICRPPKNRDPKKNEIKFCRANLIREVKEFNPELIILFGQPAVQSLIGWLLKEDVGNMSKWAGWRIPSQELNCWICPTYHPAYVLGSEYEPVVKRIWKEHIRDAFNTEGRPWQKVPDWKSQIECLYDDDGDKVHKFFVMSAAFGKPVAMDYETNMLKPDSKQARIVSCSLSNGESTISFMWGPKVHEVMREFISSGIPKIASNLDMEERWTRKFFGRGVNNWWIDTMNRAHWLDNRGGITGLKFQAFVNFGIGGYEAGVKKFLKSEDDNSNTPNRIHEIDKRELLIYGGYDALLEWHLAKLQTNNFTDKVLTGGLR